MWVEEWESEWVWLVDWESECKVDWFSHSGLCEWVSYCLSLSHLVDKSVSEPETISQPINQFKQSINQWLSELISQSVIERVNQTNNQIVSQSISQSESTWVIFGWLCWGLTSQSTIFQSCRDGAIASWVINQYFRGVKCLAQGHNTAEVGLEPRTSRSGVQHSTTEPPRSPHLSENKCMRIRRVHTNAGKSLKIKLLVPKCTRMHKND